MIALPDPDTFVVLPWDNSVARMLCLAYEPPHFAEVGGRPLQTDSRGLLIRAHHDFTARTGYEVRSGTEPEMMWTGPGLEVIKKDGASPAYQVENLERMRPIFKQVVRYAQAFGLDMIEGDYEDDGQLELNWMYDRVELTSDRLVTYRQICKQVAREQGVTASFMPKPFNGLMGNGCHHNLSLWKDGANACVEPGNTQIHLSEVGRWAVGGMLTHAADSTVIMASTVNSYKRTEGGSWAGSSSTWGRDNRTVAIRGIPAAGTAARVENRIPGADANRPRALESIAPKVKEEFLRFLQRLPITERPGRHGADTSETSTTSDASNASETSDIIPAH
jgi:glutamine synthetase